MSISKLCLNFNDALNQVQETHEAVCSFDIGYQLYKHLGGNKQNRWSDPSNYVHWELVDDDMTKKTFLKISY